MAGAKFDISKLSNTELTQVHNEVLAQLTSRAHPAADGHDSHSSVHSKNSIVANLGKVSQPGT
jgi:hypothetical protein